MAKPIVVIKGTRTLRRRIAALSKKEIVKGLRKPAREALRPLLKEIRKTTPKDQGILRRAFTIRALKRSRRSVGARVTTRSIFKTIFYGGFLELGYRRKGIKIPGIRWMRNAAEKKADQVAQIFRRKLKQFLFRQMKK